MGQNPVERGMFRRGPRHPAPRQGHIRRRGGRGRWTEDWSDRDCNDEDEDKVCLTGRVNSSRPIPGRRNNVFSTDSTPLGSRTDLTPDPAVQGRVIPVHDLRVDGGRVEGSRVRLVFLSGFSPRRRVGRRIPELYLVRGVLLRPCPI